MDGVSGVAYPCGPDAGFPRRTKAQLRLEGETVRKKLARVTAAVLALGLLMPGIALAKGGKLDKKLKKKVKRTLAACSGLAADASAAEPAVVAAKEAIAAVGAANNGKAVKFLLGVGLGATFNCPAAEVAVFGATKEALQSMTDTGARAEIYKSLKKGKRKWQIQVMLIDVIKGFDDDASVFALNDIIQQKRLDDRVAMTCAEAMKEKKDKRSVRPLIKAFGIWKPRGGRPFKAIVDALHEMTGETFTEVADWENFWDPRETTFDTGTVKKKEAGTVLRNAPKLFGSEVVSKKVVIIIDVSGSMHIRDPGGNEGGEEGEEPAGDGSVVRKKPKKPVKPAGPQPGDPDYKKKPCTDCSSGSCPSDANLPKHRMRIERAKVQLIRLVNAFRSDVRFNLVKFSTAAAAWKPTQVVNATPGNKADSIKFIKDLKPAGVTQAYKSLVEAFKCSEADTIYFISDGSPTDDAGQPLATAARQAVLDKISQLNKFRKVKINTIGLRGSSASFMQALAGLTGGKYKSVD